MKRVRFPKHLNSAFPGGWTEYKAVKREEVDKAISALDDLWFAGAFMPTDIIKIREAMELLKAVKRDLTQDAWSTR